VSRARAQAPVAAFSATTTAGCGPLAVQFHDNSLNGPLFWSWDFGNGVTSNAQNPAASYVNPGTYTVTLIVRNRSGSDAIRKTDFITVYPYPNVSFTSNLKLACSPANIQFTDQSTPGQGTITSWLWNFGDGATSNQQNPAHLYTQPGYYNVGLTVTNSGGCQHTSGATRYLRIVNGIQPNFAWDQVSAACSAPFIVNFLNQSAGPGNLSYSWSLGNNATPANSTDTNPSNVSYPATGNYNVTLQVSSSLGCTASLQQNVAFTGNQATFNGPSSICVNAPAVFTNTSKPLPPLNHWDFGDGTGSDSATATKTWPVIGPYNVKLVNHYPSCVDSLVQVVQVVSPPVPGYSVTPNGSCKPPVTVQFTDNSTGATGWQWDFGDGGSSTLRSPSHTYTSAGNFTVTLTVTGPGGCTNMISRNAVRVQPPAVTINTANPLGGCVDGSPNSTAISPTFSLNAPGGVSIYTWSAPGSDQGASTIANPTFTYPAQGNYTISLSVTTPDGCTSPVSSATVSIGTPTPATFTFTPPVCGSTQVSFTAMGTPADHYSWDFGDGSLSAVGTSPTVTHSYTTISPPNYQVTLTLYNHGCPTSTSQSLFVNPPIPKFGLLFTCPSTVNFTDSSLTDGSPTSYTWDFGDGTPPQTVTSAPWTPNPHTYAPGTYTAKLTVADGATCPPQSYPKTITIANVNPNFTLAPNTVCLNQNFTLTDASVVTPATPNFIRSYTWQIGASTVVHGPTYSISMPAVGAYPIILTDTDVNGCSYSSAPQTVQVTGPTAKFAVLPAGGGCLNSPIVFTDQSTGYPGAVGPPAASASTISTWSWKFGDGSSQTYPPGNAYSHKYADTGTYQVILTVTDNVGCSASDTVATLVASPFANFGGPDSFYCANTPLTFTDSSKGYGLTYSWDFGDGTVSPLPTHSFATSGTTYNVVLTVKDQNNCSSTKTKPVRIQNPLAAFNIYDTTAICTPLQTLFAAHAQYYDSLYWSFGDGTTSTLDSTYHFYNNFGIVTAKLFVEGPGGCFDSASRRVLVLDPNANTTLNYSPLQACDSVPVQFAITPPGYTRFTLAFGDQTSDSSQNTAPFHMYRNPNSYRPQLFLFDSTGCIVNINGSLTITVLGSTPFFSLDKHAFCDSATVQFTDFTISNDGLATETYQFGDGSAPQSQTPGSGQFSPAHFYNTTGIIVPSLKISTNSGCTETYTDTIRIHQTPQAVITVTSPYCAGLVQFFGNLTSPEQPMDTVQWAWNFGNGQTANIQAPSTRMAAGNYTVTLRSYVSFGCSDTTSSMITIYPVPVIAGPSVITTPVGIPVTIPFTYSDDSIVSYNWVPATNLDCPTCPDPVATLTFTTQYAVTVTDSHNCTSTDSILIKTICNGENYFLPNTFSPNGDGINDYFYPRGTSLYNIQSLTVFNRWGQMVFQRRDFPANAATMGWDGNFNGRPAAADAYVYVAEVICNNGQVVVLKGNVTLIR
jgi:gliding motility-associated-like protein